LTDFYDILGLQKSAGSVEIKMAFRNLAKKYHPDKNPNGTAQFTKILRAYETLSDPILKSNYDNKLSYHATYISSPAPKPKKNYHFDEKELKRRQYYNDYIKKHAKQSSSNVQQPELKQNYNEYKYILFATPLAVLLFFLIMKMADTNSSSPQRKTIIKNDTLIENIKVK
jgi:curved DNA-binding protein CbpA